MAKPVGISDKDIKGLLNNYRIGKYLSNKHIPWALSNCVYYLNTTKGRFVLKWYQEADLDNFKYISRIEEFVRKRGIPVPENIKTKSGKRYVLYKNKAVTVQRFVEGKEGKPKSDSEIKVLARMMAIVGKVLLKMPLDKGSPQNFGTELGRVLGVDLSKYAKSLDQNFRAIDKTKLRRSVIHADLGSNYLIKNNKVVAIIDWADAHEDYLILEPAVFIAANFISYEAVKKAKIKLFMKEYQRYIKINEEEKKALYYLIQARQLGVISYLASHSKQRKGDAGLKKYLKASIRKYNTFRKITPVEFLSWIN